MIACDLGYTFCGEEKIETHSVEMLEELCNSEHRFVIHCPALCWCIERFGADDTAIVLMRRDIGDIIASQGRIGWLEEPIELAKYGCKEGIISEVKYLYWDIYQRDRIQHIFEIDYDSLSNHPLWIPRGRRIHFGPRQTEDV